jgi:hypothetical protein
VDGEPDGTCDFALTHDPEIVGDVAANLVARAVE